MLERAPCSDRTREHLLVNEQRSYTKVKFRTELDKNVLVGVEGNGAEVLASKNLNWLSIPVCRSGL